MIDGVVVLDKPDGMTSFRAVQKVGQVFGQKKCGHSGTLDPLATGVLPVCVGRATKIAGYLAAQEKEYETVFRFGTATDTGDIAGEPVEVREGAFAKEAAVREAVEALVGSWDQIPPAHSAVKVGGVRSYALARRGEAVALSPRRVTVTEARVVSWSPEGMRLFLSCSKGFYVRALSRDLGGVLGVPMTVAELRRLRCGPFGIAEAVTLADLTEEGRRGEAGRRLVPIETALAGFPQWEISDEATAAVRQGRSPEPWLSGRPVVPGPGVVLLTNAADGPVALVSRGPRGEWAILRGI